MDYSIIKQLERSQNGDYVIVHELLHFRVPDHGKLWKSLMRAHLGDYERQEERLKEVAPRVKGEL